MRADLLKKAHHSGEGVLLEVAEIGESLCQVIVASVIVPGHLQQAKACQGILEDVVGECIHGSIVAVTTKHCLESHLLIVTQGDKSIESLLIDKVKIFKEELLKLLFNVVAPVVIIIGIARIRVRVRGGVAGGQITVSRGGGGRGVWEG